MESAARTVTMSTTSELKHSYHPLRVEKVIRETSDACSVVFEIPPHLREVFHYRAGQFLTLEMDFEGKPLKRCYSLASSPDTDQEHKITIKRVDGGRISNLINDTLREGDIVRVQPPEGRFVMSHEVEHAVLFAGGSGITPVISIIKSALATTQRKLTLVYANRNEGAIIFKEQLAELVRGHRGRLSVVHRLDNVDGFLRIADIARLIGSRRDGEYFLCGPDGFMTTVEKGLLAAGVASDRVHVERFVSPKDEHAEAPVPIVGETPERVSVELSGKPYDVPYVPGKTLLRASIDAGLDAPYSCEEGFCGCCVARLVEGEVTMTEDDALTPEEKKKGFILTCQAYPKGKKCTIKYLDL